MTAALMGPVLGFCAPAAPNPARAFDMRPWLRPETADAAAAWLAGEDGAADLEEWWLTAAAAEWGAECWWCADLSFELRRSANDGFCGQDIWAVL